MPGRIPSEEAVMSLAQTLRSPIPAEPRAAPAVPIPWPAVWHRFRRAPAGRGTARQAAIAIARFDVHMLRDLGLVAEVPEAHRSGQRGSMPLTPEAVRGASHFQWVVF
jgi:hypothetical protein